MTQFLGLVLHGDVRQSKKPMFADSINSSDTNQAAYKHSSNIYPFAAHATFSLTLENVEKYISTEFKEFVNNRFVLFCNIVKFIF